MTFTVGGLAQATGGRLVGGGDAAVRGVSIDSRTIEPGELFVPIVAARDGHDFVRDAVSRGAAAVLCDERHEESSRDGVSVPVIVVPDTLRALWDIARSRRRRLDARVIAVTGSNGKTTTKDMIAAALATTFPTEWTEGTMNNHLGVPLTVIGVSDEARAVVLEVGANHAGEIANLCTIVSPTIGVITNVGPAHLEGFGSVDGVLSAKWELALALPEDGRLFICGDDERLVRKASGSATAVATFGLAKHCDVRPDHVGLSAFGSEFIVQGTHAVLCLPGEHNVRNALAAWAVALHVGVAPERIAAALGSFAPTGDRSRVVEEGGVLIFDDAYNANPASMLAAFSAFERLAGGRAGRRVAVLGEMLELGAGSEQLHRDAGRAAAKCGITDLVVVGALAVHYAEGAMLGGMARSRIAVARDAGHAAELATALLVAGDALMVKGSMATRVSDVVRSVASALKGEKCSTTS